MAGMLDKLNVPVLIAHGEDDPRDEQLFAMVIAFLGAYIGPGSGLASNAAKNSASDVLAVAA